MSVKLAQSGELLAYAPVALALSSKLFEEQNLQVERSIVQGGVGVTTAVQAGDVQFGAGAVDVFSTGVSRGLPLIAVSGLLNQISLEMVVSNEFLQRKGVSPSDPIDTRLKALVGGKFGTVSLGGAPDQNTRYLVQKGGGDPQTDVEIVVLGSPPQMVAGLKQGLIDGFMLSPPVGPTVETEGFGKIFISPEDIPEYRVNQFSVLFTTQDYAKRNGEAVRRAVAAVSKASEMLANDPNRATDALVPLYQSTPRALLQMSIERHKGGFAPRGRTTAEGWQNSLTLMASLSGGSPPPNMDVQKGEGVWWTNEFLP